MVSRNSAELPKLTPYNQRSSGTVRFHRIRYDNDVGAQRSALILELESLIDGGDEGDRTCAVLIIPTSAYLGIALPPVTSLD